MQRAHLSHTPSMVQPVQTKQIAMSDSENDFSADEEQNLLNPLITKKNKQYEQEINESESEYESQDDEDDNQSPEDEGKSQVDLQQQGDNSSTASDGHAPERVPAEDQAALRNKQLKKIKELRTATKSKHKNGVVYLSRIPPYMKPAKMRQILSRFGDVDRLFLKREDEKVHQRRVRSGGNKKVMFSEGWAEFIRKKDAKLCAATLNGNIIGGKKNSFYHDDILNVKYLPGFKWADLTEQIARENDIRQAKIELELSNANKINAEFVKNVEQGKMIDKIKAKRNAQPDDSDVRRTFKQRRVTTNRADAPESQKEGISKSLQNVLGNLL